MKMTIKLKNSIGISVRTHVAERRDVVAKTTIN